uniref:HDC14317 n=1 Tax=Drosophila melanogaster TaxID=7227 RepID=Q6IJT1_DROME|nr:TPA_inf: HDC14317 [Drosophila melanogaster]
MIWPASTTNYRPQTSNKNRSKTLQMQRQPATRGLRKWQDRTQPQQQQQRCSCSCSASKDARRKVGSVCTALKAFSCPSLPSAPPFLFATSLAISVLADYFDSTRRTAAGKSPILRMRSSICICTPKK